MSEAPGPGVAVIEDSNLMDSGVAVLREMARGGGDSVSVIFDNGLADGGEGVDAVDIVALCQELGIDSVKTVDPFAIKEITEVLQEAADAGGTSVMIAQAPCTVRFDVRAPAYWVDPEKCEGCEHCLKVECSAMKVVTRPDGGTQVDIKSAECAGCGVCLQLCKHDAIFTSSPTK